MACKKQSRECMLLMQTEVGVLDEVRAQIVLNMRGENDLMKRGAMVGLVNLLGTIRDEKWLCLRDCPHFNQVGKCGKA